jgi:hypothetical protein
VGTLRAKVDRPTAVKTEKSAMTYVHSLLLLLLLLLKKKMMMMMMMMLMMSQYESGPLSTPPVSLHHSYRKWREIRDRKVPLRYPVQFRMLIADT